MFPNSFDLSASYNLEKETTERTGKPLAPAVVIHLDYLHAFFLGKNLFHQSIEEIWELSPQECLPLRQWDKLSL